MKGARDLLFGLCLVAIPLLAVRGLRGPPRLGPERAAEECDVPVELAGEGVVCLDEGEARAARVQAGDRLTREGAAGPTLRRGRMAPERLAEWDVAVDVNRASPEELASLDGIGPKLADRIVRGRPFSTVDDVGRVPGVGRRRLERLRPRLRVAHEVLDD
jgi:competence ComEA-like helix-hairpin-helix protein